LEPDASAPPPAPPPSASFDAAPAPSPAPPPAANAQPAAAAAASKPKKDLPPDNEPVKTKDDQDGLLGPFRIGPVAGVGLPSLINVGGMIKLTRYVAAGISIGIAPDVSFAYYGDATVSYHCYQIYGRVHPLGGGLFLGAAVGYALASGTAEQQVDVPAVIRMVYPGLDPTVTLRSEGSAETLVLTPELGYFYTFKSGFSLGVSAGLQIPIAPSDVHFEQNVNADIPDELVDEYLGPTSSAVKDSLERMSQSILPTIGLSIGWLL
jgi:hypothetical protein